MSSATLFWSDPDRRKTAAALGASITLHLLIILLLAALLTLPPGPETPATPETVELTLIPPPSRPKSEPVYIATSDMQQTDVPPVEPPFESDKDTRAAAQEAASGDAPLPSQQGEENPALQFENREYTAGREPRPAAPAAPPQPATTSPAPRADAKPTPQPEADLALLEPPKPKSQPRPKTQQTTPQDQSAPAGYQPQTRITRIRGNISNRGRSAVDAAATPLGKYKKMLSDAIGSRWYYYVNQQISLLDVGTLEVQFVVDAKGKVGRIRVVSNTSNESFANCSVAAIMAAEIPPIPPEIVPMLQSNQIEIEYSFTIISH